MSSQNYGNINHLSRFLKILRGMALYPIFYLLSFIWLFLHHIRIRLGKYEKMPIPVVCIGNITLGGAGKTPVVIFLANYLKENNVNVHVVSRGYGGKFKNTILVNRRIHTARNVGDEPLMISKHAKVWVSKTKKEGILSAYRAGAQLVLLDDGHQNFSIMKDINILVFDADLNLKNEKLFPLGNLRENLTSALSRADLLISIGSPISRKNLRNTLNRRHTLKIIEGEFQPKILSKLKGRNLVAFCGIGRPEKFFNMLRTLGMQVIEQISFPDHHFYSRRQITKILGIAEKNNALVVTTEKDFVKIPKNFKNYIHPINIKLNLSKNKKLLSYLKNLAF